MWKPDDKKKIIIKLLFMIVAISACGNSIDSMVDSHFGRCAYFIFYDLRKGEYEFESNKQRGVFSGAGISAAQFVVDRGSKAVISGNYGPKAFGVLKEGGVKMYKCQGESASAAIEKLRQKELSEVNGVSFDGGNFKRGINEERREA